MATYELIHGDIELAIHEDSMWTLTKDGRTFEYTKDEGLMLVKALCIGYDLPIQFPFGD